MNIFVLDGDPQLAAEYHCDRHVVKMILETAQLLSTAHRVMDGAGDPFYAATHVNHPCAKWVRESIENYYWAYDLFTYLCQEYTKRYGKVHKTQLNLQKWLSAHPVSMHKVSMTPFAQAMPECCKNADPVEAYRRYYRTEKREIATWKTSPPSWWR